ncbi:MAG: class I SAM-dependent RNA methyltransferase [Rhodospirillales bacterium CG15_BIG_FIL_POST_REV_8_21_14_020_66_15]|nr:MAG: class I SAM-dependent RNA methyltransferase [Rhodospirillales bacterium CG15_BIG_FIL_POST_REV_8_21_14_020_66_15]
MPRRSDDRRQGRGRPRRGRRPVRSAAAFKEHARATVTALAAQGDGVAETEDGRRLFIPFTVPGDDVDVLIGPARGDGFEARVLSFARKAPRGEAFCPHFETCGGCSVQHLTEADYRAWKRGLLVQALSRRGLALEVLDLAAVPRDARRRVTFQAERTGSAVVLGFAERRGLRIEGIEACPLLAAGLNGLIPSLRELAAAMLRPGERARLAAARVEGPEGPALDLVVERDREPDLAAREALAEFARTSGAARISWRDAAGAVEPVAQISPVTAAFGPASVELPPGGFMQPTAAGEDILRSTVVAGAKGAARIAELYAGAGTFTFALAGIAHVHAVDGDAALMRALGTGAGRSGLGGRVTAETRDLAARPLLPGELKDVDTVVLDPPRAGALRQVEQIVQAPGVRRVVMVSCNPQTFARDLRVLVDGGFVAGAVTPVDQFPYSHHLECVAALTREN